LSRLHKPTRVEDERKSRKGEELGLRRLIHSATNERGWRRACSTLALAEENDETAARFGELNQENGGAVEKHARGGAKT
jgi:hypothetical protein